jgi:hypothetical protein
MAKAKKSELESPGAILDGQDEETLAAIDEGIRDAEAGRTMPAEEVRQRLPKWITNSSTRKDRGSPRLALTSHQDLAGNPTSLPA